jgi:hypothetical protein
MRRSRSPTRKGCCRRTAHNGRLCERVFPRGAGSQVGTSRSLDVRTNFRARAGLGVSWPRATPKVPPRWWPSGAGCRCALFLWMFVTHSERTEGCVPRVARRHMGGGNSAVASGDEDACRVDRDHSRRPVGVAARVRRKGHGYERTCRHRFSVRRVFRYQACLRVWCPEAVREGPLESRYAADEIHEASTHERSASKGQLRG